MDFLAEIKANIKSFKSYDKSAKVRTNAKHPRENVARLISNSLSYLKDNTFKVAGRGGVMKKPELCYTITGGAARVSLSYLRKYLNLDGTKKFIGCDEGELETLLNIMHKNVLAGWLDDQLVKMQNDRKNKTK